MKVFMIGGTGLLGSSAAKKLIDKGHFVTSLALPPIPKAAPIPKEMKLYLEDFNKLSDEKLSEYFSDCYAFIFAAGVDERISGPAPIYDFYEKYNIASLKRLLPLAKKAGVKHSIILGSYFSYFNDVWKDLALYENHPYIRSRVDQENIALSFADEAMSVSVLQLPYIFGSEPGRKPVWIFLVEQLLKMKKYTLYPNGGTTMVTVNQVGELIANLIEKPNGALKIPVGYYNLTWKEMLKVFHDNLDLDRKIITIPKWMYKLGLSSMSRKQKRKGIDSGLDLVKLADIMTRNAFIDKKYLEAYDVKDDDIYQAIGESVKLSLEVLKGAEDVVGMKVK